MPLAPRRRHAPRLFYDVAVTGVTVGGASVAVPDLATAIVDSGTTVVVLAPAAFGALKAHFQTHYCHVPGLCPPGGRPRGGHPEATWFQPGYCATLTDADVAALPALTFHLGGVPLSLEPSEYMLRFEAGRLVYRCLGITYLDGLQEQEAQAILGNVLLIKYYTLYDRAGDRVGFAPSTGCVRDGQTGGGESGAPQDSGADSVLGAREEEQARPSMCPRDTAHQRYLTATERLSTLDAVRTAGDNDAGTYAELSSSLKKKKRTGAQQLNGNTRTCAITTTAPCSRHSPTPPAPAPFLTPQPPRTTA